MASDDFDIDRLAAYLHLNRNQVVKLAEQGKLPGRRVGGEWRFSASEIHHWLEDRIGVSGEDELARMETALDAGTPAHQEPVPRIADMLPLEAIAVPLAAKSREKVIRAMVDLATGTGWLWDPDKMTEAIRAREEMHPTALENGVALLHPRRPMPGILEQSFLALGLTGTGIPFGGSRGVLTDVFFLVCSASDHEHLQVLARLSRLISSADMLVDLRAARNPQEAHEAIRSYEDELV